MGELTSHIQADIVLDKKLGETGYHGGSCSHDFIAAQELTVTITLAEYRDLVKEYALKQSDIKKAEDDRYKRNTENEELRKKNEELKAENYELKTIVDKLKEENDEAMECIKGKNEEIKKLENVAGLLRNHIEKLEKDQEGSAEG